MKFATRDAYGMGVEYEGGRPGWNDAMNGTYYFVNFFVDLVYETNNFIWYIIGLPGMLGSGMPETYEMYQLLKYVKKVVTTYKRPVTIPAEFAALVVKVNAALDDLEASSFTEPEELSVDVPSELFTYWDTVATAREEYRADVQYYFSGETHDYNASALDSMIERWLGQIEIGMERAVKIGSQGAGDDG